MGKKWCLGCFHFATWSHSPNWLHHGAKKIEPNSQGELHMGSCFCGELGYTFLMKTSIHATTLSHFLMKLLRDEKQVEPKWGIGAVLSLEKVATLPKEQHPTKFNVLKKLWMNVSFHLNFSSLIPTFYSVCNFLLQNLIHWVLLILNFLKSQWLESNLK